MIYMLNKTKGLSGIYVMCIVLCKLYDAAYVWVVICALPERLIQLNLQTFPCYISYTEFDP